MSALTLVNTYRVLVTKREELAIIKAKMKALEVTIETNEGIVKGFVEQIGAVIIDSVYLSTVEKTEEKKAKVGEKELITAVKEYDPTAGAIIAEVYQTALDKKAQENAENAVTTVELLERKAKRTDSAARLSVNVDGRAELAA